MKVWISKYALSGGLKECEAEIAEGSEFVYPGAPYLSYVGFKLGRDAHTTRDAAAAAAEAMRLKKIKSLRAQIAKLEKMTF